MITVARFAELTRQAAQERGPLFIPLKANGPLSASVQREITQIAVSDVKRRFMTGTNPKGVPWKPLKYKRPNGGDKPLLDTGRLMASITGTATAKEIVIGTNHPGAALHNFGGTVKPKNGKYLAIPLTAQAKAAKSPRRMLGNARMPVFARSVNGVLVGHFLLVKQVKVPQREFMGLSDQALSAIGSAIVADAVKKWKNQQVV